MSRADQLRAPVRGRVAGGVPAPDRNSWGSRVAQSPTNHRRDASAIGIDAHEYEHHRAAVLASAPRSSPSVTTSRDDGDSRSRTAHGSDEIHGVDAEHPIDVVSTETTRRETSIEVVELPVLRQHRSEVGVEIGADRDVPDAHQVHQSDDFVDEVVECLRHDARGPRPDQPASIADGTRVLIGHQPWVVAARPGKVGVRDHHRVARGGHSVHRRLERGVRKIDDHAQIVHHLDELATGVRQTVVERWFRLEVAVSVLPVVHDGDRSDTRCVGLVQTLERVGIGAVLDEVCPFAGDQQTGLTCTVHTHDVVRSGDHGRIDPARDVENRFELTLVVGVRLARGELAGSSEATLDELQDAKVGDRGEADRCHPGVLRCVEPGDRVTAAEGGASGVCVGGPAEKAPARMSVDVDARRSIPSHLPFPRTTGDRAHLRIVQISVGPDRRDSRGACKTVAVLQVSCPSLVGREDETTVLVAALDRAVSGAGSFVWVSGEAGVGKSRLVRELCDAAAGRGLPVLVGRAVDTRTPVPFRPLFEALSGHVRRLGADGAPSVDRRALAQIVPEWRGVAEEPYQASAMEIGEGLLRFLTSIPGDACMLVLEDLHWSDPDTAAVVEYLADNLTNAPVLCVVTTRLEGSDQVGRVLSDLAARRSAARMELRRLSTDELATMASTCLGAGVDASVMSLISDFADGLPLLVEELLTTSVADGTITSTGDGWRVEAAGGPAVPERFAELVRRRTGELDDDAGRAIRVGAVLGQRFDTELLRAALGVPTETVAQALRAGVQAQLVMADRSEPTAFEFRHALTREAILEEMLPLERIEIAREALAALEQDRPDLGDAFGEQAATLAEEAGDTERAAALLLRAARRARRRGALSSAVPMLDRAWSFVNDVEPEWFEIGDALLSVLGTTGAVDQALAVGQRMLAAAGPAQRVNIHLAMARAAAEASRWDTAGEHAAAAHDLVDDAPGTHLGARIDAVRAEVAVGQGRFDDAALLARTAMEVAEEREDCELEAATALVVGRCERGRGEGNPAATFDRVVSIGREHGLPAWQLRGLMERSSLALWEFEPPQGILAAREHATNAGALVVVAHLDNFLAWQAHDRRNTDQIEPAANRCIDLAKRLRLRTLHGVATVALAVAAAHHGDRERMERLLAEADAISDGHADVVALGGVARATYWIDRDDLRHAGTALEQMMDRLRVAPAVACPERGIWVLFEALDGDEAGTAAIDELDAYVGPNHVMIDSYRSYARAVVAGRRGAVDEANREVTLAERVQPAPWFQHHARRLVAETAHADGWGDPITWLRDAFSYFETRGDDRLASSCRSLLGALGSALPRQRRSDERVPPRLRALGVSAREADVLELLAEARSTRSIAETLHVSPKTVERHIANLATKLGVEGRTAVVAFAARSALDTAD